MITNIPTAEDFYISGKELLDFAWDTIAELLTNLDNANEYLKVESEELSKAYWLAAKRRLTTALTIIQQGVEFIIKGRIASISPYILIANPPHSWPSPYDKKQIVFSQFRTIDAQDLVRVHDTISPTSFDPEFVNLFNSLREKRNSIIHSIDKNLNIHVIEVIDALLYMHKTLFPNETWGQVRYDFLLQSPLTKLDGMVEYAINQVCWELSLVFKLLSVAKVNAYFGVNKKQRAYFCPKCYRNANHDAGFEYKLAFLNPKGSESTQVYCPVCNLDYDVIREDCDIESSEECPGNVISYEYGVCLTCGE